MSIENSILVVSMAMPRGKRVSMVMIIDPQRVQPHPHDSTPSRPDPELAAELRRRSRQESAQARQWRAMASDLPDLAGTAAARRASGLELKAAVLELRAECFDSCAFDV